MERKAGQSALLFILLNKPGFRYTIIGLVLCFLAAGLYVAPLWNIAPESYGKSVRTSLYRIQEATSWKDKAIAAAKEEDLNETAFLLRMAISRNSLDPDLYRMVLTNGLTFENQTPSEIREVALRGEQLLSLTATNVADLDLLLSYNALRGLDDLSIELLSGLPTPSPDQVLELLQLLYRERRMAAFKSMYERHAGGLPSDVIEKVDYYHTAVTALEAAEPETSIQIADQLNADADDPLVRRLLLDVYGHVRVVDRFKAIFQEVQKNQEDQPEQHALYWQMLLESDQAARARLLAAQYWPKVIEQRFVRLQPVVQLAEAYLDLELADQCWEILRQVEPIFEDNPLYWMAHGDLLIQSENWQDLISHAVKLRSQKGSIAFTKVYAFFIEGFAHGKRKLTSPATISFQRLLDQGTVGDASLALRMAQGMVEVGHGEQALEFLALHDQVLTDRPVFFDLMFQAATLARNPSALSVAIKSLQEIQPAVPNLERYRLEAAVLQLADTRPSLEAFVQSVPEQDWTPTDRLMMVSARWLQGELSGLTESLDAIADDALLPHEQALLALIQIDRHVQNKQYEEARSQQNLMDKDQLFPAYGAKLESLRIQMNAPD